MDYELYKKSIKVVFGGLGLTLFAVISTILFNLLGKWVGIASLPVSIFSYWYLSKSPIPYLYGLLAIISVILNVLRRGLISEKSEKWMSFPYEKLILSTLNYLVVGIVEELERWGFIFFYALLLLFFGKLFHFNNWGIVILISVFLVTMVSFLEHSKRSGFNKVLLLLHLLIYAFLILFYGLYTAMLIHALYDISIASTEFWIRIR